MRSRDQIVDLFSTFAIIDGDYFQRWLRDPRLDRSMQRSLSQSPDTSELIWSNYWHSRWPQHPLALSHLTAYLQEPCFWIAQKIWQRLRSTEYSLNDYFQINNSQVQRVLKAYSPDRGNSLKSYASVILSNALKDQLRQRKAADICSNWALLQKASKKRLNEVLKQFGVLEEECRQYKFAWVCFREVYYPVDRRGGNNDLTDAQWQAITNLYNNNRHSQLGTMCPTASATSIKTQITQLGHWLRAYLYPAVDSLNRTKVGQETGELQDSISADPEMSSLLDTAIQQEAIQQRQQQSAQVQTLLVNAIEALSPDSREVLQLCHRDGLSQQELAKRLRLSQPTVSRRLKKAEAALLDKLIHWVEAEMNESLDPDVLSNIGITLHDWLLNYYQSNSAA